MKEAFCCICLNRDEIRYNLIDLDENNEQLIGKLQYCIPEVEWSELNSICVKCSLQLRIVYDFKKFAIQSYFNRTNVIPKNETDEEVAQDNVVSDKYVDNELEVKKYSCKKCNDTFLTKVQLATHVRLKHPTQKCNVCKKAFASRILLNNHMISEHGLSTRIRLKEALEIQEISKENNETECVQGKESLKTEDEIVVKSKSKRGRKPIEKTKNVCSICQVEFSNKYLLNRHVRNVHAAEKNHNCDICGQKFASPVYLSAHKRYHTGDRPHICSFCGKGYITTSDLYHHEKIHANKRAYKCSLCPKAFNTSSDLHKHKICVHLDRNEWKYVCNFCDRRFPLKTNLDTHTKTHTGERNFACHLCERRCINRSVLMRHIESHSNVRLFKCNVCHQDYKYQKSLDIHMTKAHGIGNAKIPERIKKYFCHVCPKSYFANNKLQKHIRTHTGERPFSCHMCDKRFIDKSYVKQHLKTAHNFTI